MITRFQDEDVKVTGVRSTIALKIGAVIVLQTDQDSNSFTLAKLNTVSFEISLQRLYFTSNHQLVSMGTEIQDDDRIYVLGDIINSSG